MRSDIDVGGGEAVARDIFGTLELGFERGQRLLARAVADHPDLFGTNRDAERLVGDRSLERAGGEEHPAVIGAAQARAMRRRKAGLGKGGGG